MFAKRGSAGETLAPMGIQSKLYIHMVSSGTVPELLEPFGTFCRGFGGMVTWAISF